MSRLAVIRACSGGRQEQEGGPIMIFRQRIEVAKGVALRCEPGIPLQRFPAILAAMCVTLCLCGLSGCSGCLAPRSGSAAPTTPPVTKAEAGSQDEEATDAEVAAAQVPQETSATGESEAGVESPSDNAAGNTGAVSVASSKPATAPSEGSDPSSGQAGSPSAGDRSGGSLEKTVSTVSSLREKAQRAVGQKNPGKAYEWYSEALDAARRFPKDSRLQKDAREITAEMQSLGAELNGQFQRKVADPTVPLIEK